MATVLFALILIATLSNAATGSADFDIAINKIVFWLALVVSVGTTVGVGFKIATYLKAKSLESTTRVGKIVEAKMEEQDKSIKSYIGDIVNTARERRDKQDYVIEQLVKRMDGLEEQQKMQMQIVLQNQQNITEFIAAQRQQQQPPTLPKKRPSSR